MPTPSDIARWLLARFHEHGPIQELKENDTYKIIFAF